MVSWEANTHSALHQFRPSVAMGLFCISLHEPSLAKAGRAIPKRVRARASSSSLRFLQATTRRGNRCTTASHLQMGLLQPRALERHGSATKLLSRAFMTKYTHLGQASWTAYFVELVVPSVYNSAAGELFSWRGCEIQVVRLSTREPGRVYRVDGPASVSRRDNISPRSCSVVTSPKKRTAHRHKLHH